ncbi:ATP-binding protein [Occultella gossypii]|uniref:ATP-binding protein n=1 Tax=Occultella gossypii TaxID=2800820 RepID=A0ABS7S9Y1_9MICO|nr:ATP-binding protein [Occultella gossypii]MBZ2197077.1 ATP-binding protein [Occultella gossypii]
MNDRPDQWKVTTHDWSVAVDRAHLATIRANARTYLAGGLQHCVLEVLAYADEEAEALGRTGAAVITRHRDGSISVADDGRGTETRRDDRGRMIRKPVMATEDVRFFDAAHPPLLPDGLPRRGMSTVAAPSRWLEHTNRRIAGSWTQRYLHGVPSNDLVELPPRPGAGTTVRFLLDPDLGMATELDTGLLERYAHLTVELRDETGAPDGGPASGDSV